MEKNTKETKVKKAVVSKEKSTPTPKVANTKKSTDKKIAVAKTTKKVAQTKTTKSSSKTATKRVTKTTAKKSSVATKKPAKKASSKTTKKATAVKKLETSPKMKIDLLEYYDLPYRYNQTVVKLLFQTPKTLFVYWDITDADRDAYKKQYGEYFFENTKPVLIIHNETMNYSFEIEINDFANSWYFNIKDANCKYIIELGRRPINSEVSIPNNYLYITSSNKLDAPNNRVLFENFNGNVIYKNAKTHQLSQKDFGSITFMNHLKNVYSISEFYNKLYKKNILDEIENQSINNPSSGII